jgi:regulator of sigma E protease
MALTLVAGLVLLGVLVFVHELGHFLFAKLFGVRVLVFSLGFGPRLFGFRKGETDYRVSALPLGGYVRMYGDDITQDVPESERDRSFLHKPTIQKSLIAFAGPLFNLVFPILLVFGFSVGEERMHSTLVGTVLPDGPAAEAGMRPGDRVVKIGDRAVTYFDELQEEVQSRPGRRLDFIIERDGERVPLTMKAGVSKSFSPLDRGREYGRIGVMPGVQRAMLWVAEGSAAYTAGLRSRDVLLEVDGAKIETAGAWRSNEDVLVGAKTVVVERTAEAEKDAPPPEPEKLTFELPMSVAAVGLTAEEARSGVTGDETDQVEEAAARTRAALLADALASHGRGGVGLYPGTIGRILDESVAARLGVEVGDRVVSVDGARVHIEAQVSQMLLVEPDAIHVVGLLTKAGKPRLLTVRLEPEQERGREAFKTLGAIPMGSGTAAGEILTRDVGVVDALKRGVQQTYELFEASMKGFWLLASGQVSIRSLGGPIMIVGIAGDAARAGLGVFARAMAFISVNLAIVNLLPIPVLDGGHLLMFAVEAIQRRRLTLKTRERATIAGLVFLVALLLFAITNDIIGLVS